jgi:hypothetical protein
METMVAPALGMRSRIPAMTASGYETPRITAVTPYTVPHTTEMPRSPSM